MASLPVSIAPVQEWEIVADMVRYAFTNTKEGLMPIVLRAAQESVFTVFKTQYPPLMPVFGVVVLRWANQSYHRHPSRSASERVSEH